MKERPAPRLDPEKLRRERRNVDFGVADETGHDHVAHEPEPRRGADTPSRPTGGATPPAR